MAERNFKELLLDQSSRQNHVCVGIDTSINRVGTMIQSLNGDPSRLGFNPADCATDSDLVLAYNKMIINATADTSPAAYKPNIAFYRPLGRTNGWVFAETIKYAKERSPQTAVITDAKYGDIGTTNTPYTQEVFDELKADAVTVHPYLGSEAMKPFLDRKNKGVLVLVRTSNPGGGQFQDLMTQDPYTGETRKLFEVVAETVAREWNYNENVGIVAGATYPSEARKARQIVGRGIPILIPGVGDQGGSAATITPLALRKGEQGVVNSSGGIDFPKVGENETLPDAIRREAQKLRQEIKKAQNTAALNDALLSTKTDAKVVRRIMREGGGYELRSITRPTSPIDFPINDEEFALKMHEKNIEAPLSKIYINLRNLPPELLEQVGQQMAEMPLDEKPDVCVGIPDAGYPIAESFAAAAGILHTRVLGKATDESGRQIVPIPFATRVGEGKTALLVDDLITRADTKFEAIHSLEQIGFKVTGIAVLFDREQGGTAQLEQAGYKVYAATKLSDTLDYYLNTDQISQEKYTTVKNYLAQAS